MFNTLTNWLRTRPHQYDLSDRRRGRLRDRVFLRDHFSGRRPARRQDQPPAGKTPLQVFSRSSATPGTASFEIVALLVVLGIAVCGLLYALMLAKQVKAGRPGQRSACRTSPPPSARAPTPTWRAVPQDRAAHSHHHGHPLLHDTE